MAQVIIRNLEDDVVASLKAKAELHGKSLEQELRDVLREAAKPTTSEKLAIIDRIRGMAPQVPQTDSVELLRQSREERTRRLCGDDR